MSQFAQELIKTELFRDAPEAVVSQVLRNSLPRDLMPGEILLSPERENRHVYLLLSGSLSLHFDSPASPEIRELSPGVSVGEMSIIDDSPPSAYVIAKEASRVLPIHRDELLDLVADTNVVARNLLRLLTQWVKANTRRIVQDRDQITRLTDHANLDALTGLYNRRWLDNALPRLLDRDIKSNLPLSILLIDVDHFKRYNDTQGHPGGDRALMALADVLKTTIRPYDYAVRFGGEEFMVILQNTGNAAAVVVAERIRKAVETRPIVGREGNPLPSITVSIGLATSADGSSPESLVAAADQQLYQAKAEGRNRICH